MKENPIRFNGEMIRALLSGHKTQTRRSVNNDNEVCRYGEIGGRLWVREKINGFFGCDAEYEADQEDVFKNQNVLKRKSEWEELPCQMIDPQDMPRWASRITLEITGIKKESIWHSTDSMQHWLHSKESGPLVWVIDFKRIY